MMRSWHRYGLLAVGLVGMWASAAHALRANMRQDIDQLERMGHFEEALFYRRSSMDMILAVHAAWSGAPYDPDMDAWVFETRTDRRYWNLVNGQKRPIADLLAKAKLTPAQLAHLDLRVRVYVEDHLSPEFEEMGNFYFRRKAMCLERAGMFLDASYRRRLTGYYCQRVCEPYYATMAAEMERQGQKTLAAAYRSKAEFFRAEALREFRRCNGDLGLSKMAGDQTRQPRALPQVIEALKRGLESEEDDTRLAAGMALTELHGLQDVLKDGGAPSRVPPPAGMTLGVRAMYFTDPDQSAPVASAVLPSMDIGFTGDERFNAKLRPFWTKPDVFPAGAAGQFLVILRGRLSVEDGAYRFYVRTERNNRATVRIIAEEQEQVIISPRNDKQLMYSMQIDYKGQPLSRVDFSQPVQLKKGLVEVVVEYQGAEAKGPFGTPGLRMYWSDDKRVMEPIPAAAWYAE